MGRRNGNVNHSTASKASKALDTVNDSSSGISVALDKVREMNESSVEVELPREPVPSELKDLVLFGKVIEEVHAGGFIFKMSTLNNRQQKKLVRRLVKLDAEERLMNVKEFTLAQVIQSINGQPLEELYDGDDDLSVDDKKSEVVSEFQSNLVEKLFNKYEDLVKKSNSFFESGDLSDKIKN